MKAFYGWAARAARAGVGFVMILSALSASALAGRGPVGVPEIDPGTMGSALTLLTCGMLILTGRKRGR